MQQNGKFVVLPVDATLNSAPDTDPNGAGQDGSVRLGLMDAVNHLKIKASFGGAVTAATAQLWGWSVTFERWLKLGNAVEYSDHDGKIVSVAWDYDRSGPLWLYLQFTSVTGTAGEADQVGIRGIVEI